MKVKIIQADTRSLRFFLESRNLTYGPPNQMDFQLIASLNKNVLIQPNEANSIGCIINLLKCRLLNYSYEFIKGDLNEWEQGGTKSVTWIKIRSLIEQIKDEKNKDIDIFCFIDTDAWIRDERLFAEFCEHFVKSPETLAIPRDIELPNNSYLNSGFLAVKNTPAGLNILETVYTHPDYRNHEKLFWWEQSELSVYQKKHPEEIMILSLNDFNTPCGRIVRHCWTKHLVEPFVLEEAVATLTKITLTFTSDPNYSLGSGFQILAPS